MSSSDKDKIDFAKFILEHNSDLVGLADTKAGILLGINGIILALLFGIEKLQLSQLSSMLFLSTSIFLAASSFFTIMTIFPRLKIETSPTRIYFMKIKESKREEFINSWNALDEQTILKDYILNIHNLTIIQTKKFKFLQIAIVLNIVGIGILVASLFSYLGT